MVSANVSARQYGDLLVRYLKPQWPKVVVLAALLLGSIALQLVNPQILGGFVDIIQQGGAGDALAGAALLFLAVVLIGQVTSAATTYFSEDVGWTATNAMRVDLAAHLLYLDLGFHQVHSSGELIERIDGDVDALASFFSTFVINILGNLILLAGILILLYAMDWRMGLAITLFAAISLALLF
ncbi:MAG: ABC transporter ATP-binding protein [Chloroflexi bacterium]|nr:ABC transporter ATP-binding protein [Chloroflexota bacterium]